MVPVLVINYYWPPSGGSAVQRWLNISRHFEAQGIQSFVVTIREDKATFPMVDESLLKEVPQSAKTYRTDTSELLNFYKKTVGKGKVPSTGLVDEPNPNFLQKISRFMRGNFFLPDPRIGWNKHAFKQAKQLIEQHNIKVVFTAGPPHSTHLVGLKLKKTFKDLYWVADIHDYWTDILYLSKFYRTSIANFFDKKMESNVLLNANKVMTHCQTAKKILDNKVKKDISEKIHVHTMGFDEPLFLPKKPSQKQNDFTITFAGVFPDSYEPLPFIKAMSRLKGEMPTLPMVFNMVGIMSPKIKQQFIDYGLGDILQEKGYMKHSESVKQLGEASVLFLINPKSKNEHIHVPGKLYEYLAAQKPIVSISSSMGESKDIIDACNAGKHFSREDIDGVFAYLKTLAAQWLENGHVDLETNNVFMKYSREQEAINLANAIKEAAVN
jgi:glycosyltransferase involved in cell wall biosynthesis